MENKNTQYSWTDKGTLHSKLYDDVYFKDGKGLEEGRYVFLEGNQFYQKLETDFDQLAIGELGFGTGLNFLTAWSDFEKNCQDPSKKLLFVTCEKHLLDQATFSQALEGFREEFRNKVDQLLAKIPAIDTGFHLLHFDNSRVQLLLLLGDATDCLRSFEGKVDMWFLDGFAPAKNPEMWSDKLIQQIARHSKKATSFATFTAAREIRERLENFGFEVERIKGFAWKKHMIRGVFTGFDAPPSLLKPYFRLAKGKIPKPEGKVAIIGAGLAGTSLAYRLSQENLHITLFDKADHIASGASGNPYGMLMPLISKKPDLLGKMTEAGFFRSLNHIHELGLDHKSGLYEFAIDQGREQRLSEGSERYADDYSHFQSSEIVNKVLALNTDLPASYQSLSLAVSPKKLCEANLAHSEVELKLNTEIVKLEQSDDQWNLEDQNGDNYAFDIVIIANARACREFEQCAHYPIRSARGQLVTIPKDMLNTEVNYSLNFKDYFLPEYKGSHVLGATFHVDDFDESIRKEDSEALLEKLSKALPGLIKDEVKAADLQARVAFRAVTPERFPIIGAAIDKKAYDEQYGDLYYGKPISRYPDAVYHPNLYLSVAHGSRGLMSSMWAADIICNLIYQRPLNISHELWNSIHPGRFAVREYKRKLG